MVERNVPTLGLKGVRKWLDKRCEKKVAKQGPVPAPTQPLPWDYFRRMPQRLKGGRHYNLPLPTDSAQPAASAPGSGACPLPCQSLLAPWINIPTPAHQRWLALEMYHAVR
jgi:hypothetical protein